MRKMFLIIGGLFILGALACGSASADATAPAAEPSASTVLGWGPSVVGSVGAFYLNGNYSLLSAGVNLGAAYTWDDRSKNVSSAGIYLGPQSTLANGVTTTSINVMAYLDLYKTATVGSFGVGLGTRLWESGVGIKPTAATTFLALGYKF